MARDGMVTARRALVTVLAGEDVNPYALGQAWPPCRCPRHREENAAHRFRRT
ncbi:hypothetical protein IGW14_03565 [Streptomyces hygroscopicus subsp. hygroscopicus]|nr:MULTISPECIES: hypothetical protein [Streptomyces]MBW8087142.1 hypothetical protein [Streptomyces hygroscopicus subsp. hygroscopicus]